MNKLTTTDPPNNPRKSPKRTERGGDASPESEAKPEGFADAPRHKQMEILLQLVYLGLKVAESAAGLIKHML